MLLADLGALVPFAEPVAVPVLPLDWAAANATVPTIKAVDIITRFILLHLGNRQYKRKAKESRRTEEQGTEDVFRTAEQTNKEG